MASTAAQLAALGNDLQWQYRVRSLVLQQAAVVYAEVPGTPERRAFAKSVIQNSDLALRLTHIVANGTNVKAANTTYDFIANHVLTDATDAQIFAQIFADWNMLAGA